MNWETIVVGIIAALPGIWGLWRGRHKLDAETASEWVRVARETAEELRQEQERRKEMGRQVIQLDEKMRRMEVVLEHYRDGTNRLIGQLQSLGHKPVWIPHEKTILQERDDREGDR